MIVYNVARGFFDMKADAEALRKELGLPKDALNKIDIRDRTELADFLTALCTRSEAPAAQGVKPMDIADDALDFIPSFVKRDWERRAQFAKGGSE
jgi:hypothetical protein